MGTVVQDLRYAARGFARAPGFTIAAVLSLAIGIGANTAIFSVASALLLRPLPYQDADRLAILWNRSPGLGITEDWFSTAQYFDIRNGHTRVRAGRDRDRRQLQPDRRRRAGARRHDPRVLEPAADARRAADHRPAVHRRRRRAGTDGARAAWLRDVDAPLRRRHRASSAAPHAERPAVSESSACCRPSFDLPREVMPTLGVAEHAEIMLPLPLGPDARAQSATARTTTSSQS